MPWPYVSLETIAHVGAGNSAPQDPRLFVDGTVPFIRTSDVGRVRFGSLDDAEDWLNAAGATGLRRWPVGTILFPKSGASTFLNHRVITEIEACVASHLATIVPNLERVDPRFLLYFLRTADAKELTQDQGYPSLRLPEIGAIRVPLPPLQEQQRIAAILDEAFEGIAKATANTERNIENARELFATHLARSMKTDNAATFHRSTTKQGWTETTLGESCEMYQPKTISTKEMDSNGTFPVFGANGQIGFYDKYNHERPEILVTCRGATCGTVNVSLPKSWVTGNAMVVRPKDNSISQNFLRYLLQGGIDLSKAITGAAQPQITRTNLNPLRFSYPADFVMQEEIVAKLDQASVAREQLVTIYTAKLTSLNDLKKALLHKAFTGQLTNAPAVTA